MTDADPAQSGPRESPYNAVVREMRLVHDALMILRLAPDAGVPDFDAGQYATLGLGAWEPRIDHSDRDQCVHKTAASRLIRRAYSISCPMLNDRGELVTCGDLDFLEFYIARVLRPDNGSPKLTPRLFALTAGSRLHLAPHVHGTYRLGPVTDDDTVLFLATGTGEAPHNSMIAELLKRGHRGQILSAVCVRCGIDLAYLEVHRELEQRFANYRYVTLTTREPENVDARRADFVGKQYLQDYVRSGRLEEDVGVALDRDRTHVYLCGNPEMIGLPPSARPGLESAPPPGGMVELLTSRGLRLDHPHQPGQIHCERFW